MRKIPFIGNGYYHIYNRGVDKRKIFLDANDFKRFFQSMEEFNVVDPIGSIYENFFRKKSLGSEASKPVSEGKLVEFLCYCLNPNHYHFLLRQVAPKGIEKFMHRLGGGYTKYFNQKYDRSGALFQGVFKSVYVDSDAYGLHLSAYINLNNRVHKLGSFASRSSWDEYLGKSKINFCEKDSVLKSFKNLEEYKNFAEESLKYIHEKRDLEKMLLE